MPFAPGILPGVENDVLVWTLTKLVSCVHALITFSFTDEVHAGSQWHCWMNDIHVRKTDFLFPSIIGTLPTSVVFPKTSEDDSNRFETRTTSTQSDYYR